MEREGNRACPTFSVVWLPMICSRCCGGHMDTSAESAAGALGPSSSRGKQSLSPGTPRPTSGQGKVGGHTGSVSSESLADLGGHRNPQSGGQLDRSAGGPGTPPAAGP